MADRVRIAQYATAHAHAGRHAAALRDNEDAVENKLLDRRSVE